MLQTNNLYMSQHVNTFDFTPLLLQFKAIEITNTVLIH